MTNFVAQLISNCLEEWDFFQNQEINSNGVLTKRGMRETDEGFWQRVGQYWLEGTGKKWTGRDTGYAWSAAFISYIMKKSGAGNNFRYSESHSTYIRWSTANRLNNKSDNFFFAFDFNEYIPKVGDLVCYSRQPGVTYGNQPSWYMSHSDLVVEVLSNVQELKVIGGNVSNAVTLKHLRIDSNGMIIDTNNKWFAVIENRL